MPGGLVIQVQIVGVLHFFVHKVYIFGNVRSRRAVCYGYVFGQQFVYVYICVPKLFSQNITSQTSHFVALLAAALMEHAAHVVLQVEFQIIFLHRKVGVGQQQVVEVHRIVPYEQVVAHLRPFFYYLFAFGGGVVIAPLI